VTTPRETGRPIRVLIIEDHPVVAEGLASLLEDYPDLAVAGAADSVAEAGPMSENARADVAVIDFYLPDGTGAQAAELIRVHSPSTAMVFLSADDSDAPLMAAIEAGARSYLLKSATGGEIVKAIRSAAAGETLIPAGTITRVLARQRDSARRARVLDSLTPREREILVLMTGGADNRAIARDLCISYATVRTHVRSILLKLGARSRLDAVSKATRWGFRPDEPA
jgi:two-component system, NarL family, response regulator DevR